MDVWVRCAAAQQDALRPAVDAVMALLEDACRKSCAGVEYDVLALSPADLAAHRDRPVGYNMAALEASEEDTMYPTDPPLPTRAERVRDIIGHSGRDEVHAQRGCLLAFTFFVKWGGL